MRRMGAPHGCRRGFREARIAHLALANQVADGADRVLDRNGGIDTRGIVQIDVVHSQPAKGIGQRSLDESRPAIETKKRAIRFPERAEFYRQDGLFAPALNCLGDEHFVVAHAIEVAGIEQVDSGV